MATATRKKSAQRPDATERPAPLVDLSKDAFDETKVGQVFLFEIDGVDYYIPDDAHAMVLQEAARLERETGQSAAMWYLFGELLSDEALKALRSYKGLRRKHLTQLYGACVSTLTGPKA